MENQDQNQVNPNSSETQTAPTATGSTTAGRKVIRPKSAANYKDAVDYLVANESEQGIALAAKIFNRAPEKVKEEITKHRLFAQSQNPTQG